MTSEIPGWAKEAGQDCFGTYVAFTIGGVSQRLRWIPPGKFMMGSPEEEQRRYFYSGFRQEIPQYQVTLREGFWLFDTPCTQALWEAVVGYNPSRFRHPMRPVERVNWMDVQKFLKELNARLPGIRLRLPSEAQWEYACRAGTSTATYAGDLRNRGPDKDPVLDPVLDAIAWYGGNSGTEFDLEIGQRVGDWSKKKCNEQPAQKAGTRLVSEKAPNPWGLYDMLGNVWEWCEDYWHHDSGSAPDDGMPRLDPSGPAGHRVIRGGSWWDWAVFVRAACRFRGEPTERIERVGFRCIGVPRN